MKNLKKGKAVEDWSKSLKKKSLNRKIRPNPIQEKAKKDPLPTLEDAIKKMHENL